MHRIAHCRGARRKNQKEKSMGIPGSRVVQAYRWAAWFKGTNLTEAGTVYAESFYAACDRAVECALLLHPSIPLRAIKVAIE